MAPKRSSRRKTPRHKAPLTAADSAGSRSNSTVTRSPVPLPVLTAPAPDSGGSSNYTVTKFKSPVPLPVLTPAPAESAGVNAMAADTTMATRTAPQSREALGLQELKNKRDAFVEAMNMLSHAAESAARSGSECFDFLAPLSKVTTAVPVSPAAAAALAAVYHSSLVPVSSGYNAHVRRSQSVAPDRGANKPPRALAPPA